MSKYEISEKEAADMQEYIQQSEAQLKFLNEKNASLETEKGELENQLKNTEKQAGEAPVLNEALLDQALDKLASSGIANQEDLPVLKANIMGDPNVAVGYLDKIAEVANRTRSVIPIGSTFKEATHTPVNGLGAGRPSDALFETTFG